MDLQKMMDTFSDGMRVARCDYHLTLGKLRKVAEEYPDARFILLGGSTEEGSALSISDPHSYRGYYSDCAFETTSETVTGRDVVAMCDHIANTEFVGYKGGEYRYEDDTPLWNASYGCCGLAITDAMAMPVHPDEGGVVVVLGTREID